MPTTRAVALRRANVDARIAEAGRVLSARFGVEVGPPPTGPAARDPRLGPVVQMEAMADLLDQICAATDPDAEPYAPDLDAMKRAELDAYAVEVGVEDPDTLPNKAAVVDAIRAKEAGVTTNDDPKNPPNPPPESEPEPMPPPTDDGAGLAAPGEDGG
jgi:hypothetical protein